MKLVAYTSLLINFCQCLPTSTPQPQGHFYLPPIAGIPLSRYLSSTGAHLGNNNLISIAQTNNNILEGNGKPFVDFSYGMFIENLGDFYKFNNKGKGEERLEKMVEEGMIKDNESVNNVDFGNINNIQLDSNTQANEDFNTNQPIPLTTTNV